MDEKKKNIVFGNDGLEKKKLPPGTGMGIGVAIGMGAGVAIGAAMDKIGLGIAIGTAIGTSIGLGIEARNKEHTEEPLEPGQKKLIKGLVFGGVGVFVLMLIIFFFLVKK